MSKQSDKDYLLSVVMPVYNEEATLPLILDRVLGLDIHKEIIAVNDCSKDRSAEILQDYTSRHKNIRVFHHEKNLGKGGALQTGFDQVQGKFVVIQDADLEYNPEEFSSLLNLLTEKGADVVYGSRFLTMQKEKTKLRDIPLPSHYFGNKFLNIVTNLIYRKKLTDMETCYKMFRSSILKEIRIKSRGFDIEPELTAKLCRRGYDIHELPISYNARSYQEGKKITWKDGFAALKALVKYKFVD